MKCLNIFSSVILGATLTSLAFAAQPASAVSLTHVSSANTDVLPEGWNSLNWVVEGKAGSTSTWEFALENGSYQVQNDFNWIWQDNVQANWSLNWDGTTVTFSLTPDSANTGSSASYTRSYTSLTSPLDFDGFYLWTRADGASTRVNEGTKVTLEVNQVNGVNVTPSATSSVVAPSSGQAIAKEWYASDTSIFSLGGTMSIDWGSINPQTAGANSRIGFKIRGFDINKPVPEPGVTLGLLMMGALGVISHRKNKNIKDEN